MNNLVILTNAFPYGDWESYLETEVKYLDNFNNIQIYALQTRPQMLKVKRDLPQIFKFRPIVYLSRLSYFLKSYLALLDKNFYREIGVLIKKGKLSFPNIVALFVYLTRANYEFNEIVKGLKQNSNSEGHLLKDSIIYSYRFEYQPYIAIKLKEKFNPKASIYCRAHRGDLYEYMRPGDYIPLREYILDRVDRVYPCSKDGEDYLKEKFPEYEEKIEKRYLGTLDFGNKEYEFNGLYKLVSCSRTVPVKRIEKIIEALALIDRKDISWTHYGDGELTKSLKELAEEKLGDKIKYTFKGAVDNKELMKEYFLSNYYAFINVSSSEGLPVSIMESQSFSIPTLATDVGGTREIVIDSHNGRLLNKDITNEELAHEIESFLTLEQEDYKIYRKNARDFWNKNFNAEVNYRAFVEEIKKEK